MARTKPRPRPTPTALNPLPPNTQAILRHGDKAVAYHIPVSPSTPAHPIPKSTISLPPGSRWTSGLHFHTAHKEYLRLVKGFIFVELDGHMMYISARAGGQVSVLRTSNVEKIGLEVEVNRYARHNWGRADEYIRSHRSLHNKIAWPEDASEEVVVEEWTDPADISKPLFFWNLNGVIASPQSAALTTPQHLAKKVLGSWWMPFQLFVIFWEFDNWPIFFDCRHLIQPYLGGSIGRRLESMSEHITTFIVLFVAKVLSLLLGIEAVSRTKTPDKLWKAYIKKRK